MTDQTISTERRREMFEWLEELRVSGQINMFLASGPLSLAFQIPESQARTVLATWMSARESEES